LALFVSPQPPPQPDLTTRGITLEEETPVGGQDSESAKQEGKQCCGRGNGEHACGICRQP